MEIFYSSKFLRAYKKLPKDIKDKLKRKEKVLVKNAFDSSLKTHKLHEDFSGFYAISIDYKYRLIFELFDNTVVFYDMGDHAIY